MENDLITPNGTSSQPVAAVPRAKRPSNIWLIIVAALFIIVPFLTWYFTWFGRALSDEKIAEYLADEKHPRYIQHALAQIEARMEKNDASVRKFYPKIIELAKNTHPEVRMTVAWVMGQDNKSEEFHRALLELLKDTEPLVRRNAALQLVRFTDANGRPDASGRPELRAMLQPFEVKSPVNGTIVSILPAGSNLRAGALLARIRLVDSKTGAPGYVQELRAPVDGEIASVAVKEAESIISNQQIASLKPDKASIFASLRGLSYVGTSEDLPFVETLAQTSADADVRNQASITGKAIRSRPGSSG